MSNIKHIATAKLYAVSSIMHPIYKTNMRVERSLWVKHKREINNMFNIGLFIRWNGSNLTNFIKHTIRRIEFSNNIGENYAEIEYKFNKPHKPVIYVSELWEVLLTKNIILALSVVSHELFHMFHYFRYGKKGEETNMLKSEELAALMFEKKIISSIRGYEKLKREALKDVNSQIRTLLK